MQDKANTILWGLGGVVWGIFIFLASFPVAGAGHGWVAALPFGFLAIFAAPLATIAWARRKSNGKRFAMAAVAVALIADVLLLLATLAEGKEYFLEVLSMALIWLVFWVSWQVLAAVAFFYKPR